jgi:signal transduction protein with GAF and PtsI domain
MRPGEGITGTAAVERAPVMIPSQAHLDPRFKLFRNLPEEEYESILAVPILAREKLEGRAERSHREPRVYADDEIDLLLAIAAQVAQSIEHAKLYAQAQRRVEELEALAKISEAVSESLYLEESLEAIVKTTMDAVSATGAALVLEDGKIAWPEGRAGAHAVRRRCAGSGGRSASSSPTATRRSPTRSARCSRRSRTTRRSRSSTGAR